MNIVVDHVTKTIHRAVVLQDISLNFESGKVYGLQGENGSGKTMLLRLMCGLIYATEGSVSVNDRRLGKDLDFPESVGVMIESPAFIDEYTGQKNLELLAGLKQLISVSDIHNTLQAVGLDPNDKRTFKKYSLGMKQRLAPDFVGYNLAAEGYMLRVNRFEIVDYRAYTSALQYDGADRSRIPDKVALVSVTVSQQNSPAEGFPLTELSLYTTDMLMNMDWDLLGVVNPILDGATGIRLQDGASCDILLPFDLYRYRFTSAEWNRLEQSNIWLQVTNYPTRKIVRVNIGEE